VLRFRTPRIYSEDDVTKYPSSDAYDEVNLISGVYRVIQLVSKFEGGKFTQTLDCVIDNEIDLRNFVKELDSVVRTPDTPATVSDLTNPIPDTNIRNSRLITDNTAALEGVVNNLRNTAGPANNTVNSVPSSVPGVNPLLPGGTTSGINSRRII
jgi:hypothetical protein